MREYATTGSRQRCRLRPMSRPPVLSIPSKPSRCRKHLEQRVEKQKTAVRGQDKLVKESTC